jgi:hypothetical protein
MKLTQTCHEDLAKTVISFVCGDSGYSFGMAADSTGPLRE